MEGRFNACEKGIKTNDWKLTPGKLILRIRHMFVTERLVKHWNKLPREVVESPFLSVFIFRLTAFLEDSF